jgi:hypothetical protein
MGMREEFEAWVVSRKVVTRHGAGLNQNSDGTYSDYRINDRWLAWQASRAALVIELPPRDYYTESDDPRDLLDYITAELTDGGVTLKTINTTTINGSDPS